MFSASNNPYSTPSNNGNSIGWWEQNGLGRQPMDQLQIDFANGHLSGSGADIVGLFSLKGIVAADGKVLIHKKYFGKHSVDYVGQYDGEGTFYGTWKIELFGGHWSIKLLKSTASDIMEIQPLSN